MGLRLALRRSFSTDPGREHNGVLWLMERKTAVDQADNPGG